MPKQAVDTLRDVLLVLSSYVLAWKGVFIFVLANLGDTDTGFVFRGEAFAVPALVSAAIFASAPILSSRRVERLTAVLLAAPVLFAIALIAIATISPMLGVVIAVGACNAVSPRTGFVVLGGVASVVGAMLYSACWIYGGTTIDEGLVPAVGATSPGLLAVLTGCSVVNALGLFHVWRNTRLRGTNGKRQGLTDCA